MSTVTEHTPAKGEARAVTGAYVILEQASGPEGPDTWRVRNQHVEATSADAAIKACYSKAPTAGTFLAIPARSWKPRTLKVETRQVVRLD